ncbi:MAG: hypothetical protein KF712_16235 [Akkermansiaceae bacterium]|nr:hypothetical protein [Akkermansiaceae bacterium]
MLTGPVDQTELQKRRMKAVRLFEKDISAATSGLSAGAILDFWLAYRTIN